MVFNVAGHQYSVSIIQAPLIRNGSERRAWAEEATRRILISTSSPNRRRELLHELRHVWQWEIGQRAQDEEADALDVSTFCDLMIEQLESHGGIAALERMQPEPAQTPQNAPGSTAAIEYRRCGACDAPIAHGSIQDGPPVRSETYKVWFITRAMECECGCKTEWAEVCSEIGEPTGQVMPWPKPTMRNTDAIMVQQ